VRRIFARLTAMIEEVSYWAIVGVEIVFVDDSTFDLPPGVG
jgi:hypothetical protein